MPLDHLPTDWKPTWPITAATIPRLTPYHVARALARIGRFGGQTPHYYSVARHSVIVAHVIRTEDPTTADRRRRVALMHDAHEILTGDLCRPYATTAPELRAAQHRIDRQLFAHFGCIPSATDCAAVTAADNHACDLELWAFENPAADAIQHTVADNVAALILEPHATEHVDAALWLRHWYAPEQYGPFQLNKHRAANLQR